MGVGARVRACAHTRMPHGPVVHGHWNIYVCVNGHVNILFEHTVFILNSSTPRPPAKSTEGIRIEPTEKPIHSFYRILSVLVGGFCAGLLVTEVQNE